MRMILVAAAIAGAASVMTPSDAQAQFHPWCAFYTRGAGSNCGFTTYGQCMATVSGIGGWCQRNPFLAYGPGPYYGPGVAEPGPVYVHRRRHPRRRH
jgi:hypothetical protein